MSVRRNALYSSTATLVAEIVTLPICTIKTNYQNTTGTSMIATIKSIYARQGLKSFFNASAPAIVSQMFSTMAKFTLYQYLQDSKFLEIKQSKFLDSMKNGITSGILSTTVTHPLDVIKVAWQMNTPLRPQLQQLGPSIFYRGYSKTLSKIAVSSALFFPIYDQCQRYINNSFLASIISAVISTTVMQPLDYMKTRHVAGLPCWHGHNISSYYRGLSLNLMRIVPHFTITMTLINLKQ